MKSSGRLLERLAAWTQRSETTSLLVLSGVVGLLVGVATTLYRLALIESYRVFFRPSHEGATVTVATLAMRVALPVAGGFIVGVIVYRLIRIRGGHGVPSVIKAVLTGHLRLPRSMAARSALSVITMTMGASAGPEGPIVEIGAVVGSQVGNRARVRRDQMGTLVGCGAASGIAAIFNAPLGGVLFALELILRDFTVRRFSPVVISAVIASVTTQILLPGQPVFRVPPGVIEAIVPNFSLIGAFVVFGPLCALFSALYISGMYRTQDVFQRSVKVPTWLKPALGGLLVGLLALLLPGIQSEGYEFINSRMVSHSIEAAVEARPWVVIAAGMFLYSIGKIVATSLTLGSGFVGGAFAPALFIGAALGGAFGTVANHFFPEATPSPIVFALVGMAGVVGPSLGAPISALIIVYEITGGRYQILLPLLITVATAAALTRRMRPGSIYTLSLLRDGFDVEAATQQRDPLAGLTAADAMTVEIPRLRADMTLHSILDQVAQSEASAFCIVDKAGKFRGLITLNDLRAVLTLGHGEMGSLLLAGEIADSHPQWLSPKSPLSEALAIFSRSDVEAIPVLDPSSPDKILGVIHRRDLLDTYRKRRSGGEVALEGAGASDPPSEIDSFQGPGKTGGS